MSVRPMHRSNWSLLVCQKIYIKQSCASKVHIMWARLKSEKSSESSSIKELARSFTTTWFLTLVRGPLQTSSITSDRLKISRGSFVRLSWSAMPTCWFVKVDALITEKYALLTSGLRQVDSWYIGVLTASFHSFCNCQTDHAAKYAATLWDYDALADRDDRNDGSLTKTQRSWESIHEKADAHTCKVICFG